MLDLAYATVTARVHPLAFLITLQVLVWGALLFLVGWGAVVSIEEVLVLDSPTVSMAFGVLLLFDATLVFVGLHNRSRQMTSVFAAAGFGIWSALTVAWMSQGYIVLSLLGFLYGLAMGYIFLASKLNSLDRI